jgi:hypothetical protein
MHPIPKKQKPRAMPATGWPSKQTQGSLQRSTATAAASRYHRHYDTGDRRQGTEQEKQRKDSSSTAKQQGSLVSHHCNLVIASSHPKHVCGNS